MESSMKFVYCGNNLPAKFTSKSSRLKILFVSDESENKGGFKLIYSTSISKSVLNLQLNFK